MRWAGHLVRMDDSRIPKRLFYGEFLSGKKHKHKPKRKFKDIVKDSLNHMGIDCKGWKTLNIDCAHWKHLIANGVASFESYRVARAVVQRTCKKGEFLPNVEPRTRSCDVSGGYLLSNAGLFYHMRTHVNWTSTTVPVITLLLLGHENLSHTCSVCMKSFQVSRRTQKTLDP